MQAHAGAESLKKPHHIVTLRFSEVLVKDHANSIKSYLYPAVLQPISVKMRNVRELIIFFPPLRFTDYFDGQCNMQHGLGT